MNRFGKIPVNRTLRLLGIQENQKKAPLYCYVKDSEEIVRFDHFKDYPDQIDFVRALDEKAKKRIRKLEFGNCYEKTLKINCIKAYLFLHFVLTDLTNGKCENVAIAEIASACRCSQRTVLSSLDDLSESGFITYKKRNPRFIDANITDYSKMFMSAKNGGSGYFQMTSDACESILALSHLNDIRVALISIFNSVRNERMTASKTLGAIISFNEYKKALPEYIRPCHIRDSINGLSGILGAFSESYKEFHVKLSNIFSCKPIQNQIRQEAKVLIRERLNGIQKAVLNFNEMLEKTLAISSDMISGFNALGFHLLPSNMRLEQEDVKRFRMKELQYNSDLIDSLSSIAINYDISLVNEAIITYYREYVEEGRQVDNVPGLITSIIKENLNLGIEIA